MKSEVLTPEQRFGLNPQEADEVAQEVFVRAWRGLGRFQGRAKLSTWLYRITFNEAQRALSRRRPAGGDTAADDEDPVAAVAADEHHGPHAQALDREFSEVLDRALARLPPEWRVAVVLRDLEGLSTSEAAEIVHAAIQRKKQRVFRSWIVVRVIDPVFLRESVEVIVVPDDRPVLVDCETDRD